MDISIEPGEFNDLRRPDWDWDNHPDVVVCRINDEPVAALRMFPRILQSDSVRMSMMGIGGVYTKVDWRSMGLATDMLEWVIDNAENRFACIGLFSSREVGEDNLYCRAGFSPLKKFLHGRLYCKSLSQDVNLLESHEWRLDPLGRF